MRSLCSFAPFHDLIPFLQVDEIPQLTTGCQQFMEEAQGVLEKRRVNKTMLANHPLLADLLEIPQLMDT